MAWRPPRLQIPPSPSLLALRLASQRWPDVRPELMRAIAFVLLSLLTVCAFGPSVLLAWSALALLLWNIFRVRRAIYAVFDAA